MTLTPTAMAKSVVNLVEATKASIFPASKTRDEQAQVYAQHGLPTGLTEEEVEKLKLQFAPRAQTKQ